MWNESAQFVYSTTISSGNMPIGNMPEEMCPGQHYARIAFFALAAIGSASLRALKVINRAYLLLPLWLEASFGSKW
jgi:hypothetical protein